MKKSQDLPIYEINKKDNTITFNTLNCIANIYNYNKKLGAKY